MASPPPEIQLQLRSRPKSSSDEIMVVPDLESGSPVCCRICLEDNSREGDELIAPCLCKGTQQFVHRQCLDHWRSVKEGFAFSHCSTCKAVFQLQVEEVNYDIVTRIKHKLFVVGDVFRDFLVAQLIIAVLGGFLYLVDIEGTVRNAANNYSTLFSSQNSLSFYYTMGVIGFILVLGLICIITRSASLANADQRIAACQNILLAMFMWKLLPMTTMLLITLVAIVICGIAYGLFLATKAVKRSWHQHYHILTKRNLTQVYVVVDQGGHYTTPTLDPRHEQHLRCLNLL